MMININVIKHILFLSIGLFYLNTQTFASENTQLLTTENSKNPDIKPKCSELKFNPNDGYLFGDQCFYPQKTLLNAYQDYRVININNDNGKYLIQKLTLGKNIKQNIKSVDLSLDYKWINKNNLEITLQFGGGITTISFKNNPNGTIVKTIHDAD